MANQTKKAKRRKPLFHPTVNGFPATSGVNIGGDDIVNSVIRNAYKTFPIFDEDSGKREDFDPDVWVPGIAVGTIEELARLTKKRGVPANVRSMAEECIEAARSVLDYLDGAARSMDTSWMIKYSMFCGYRLGESLNRLAMQHSPVAERLESWRRIRAGGDTARYVRRKDENEENALRDSAMESYVHGCLHGGEMLDRDIVKEMCARFGPENAEDYNPLSESTLKKRLSKYRGTYRKTKKKMPKKSGPSVAR